MQIDQPLNPLSHSTKMSKEDEELYKMLKLMSEMGLTIKFDPKDNKTLVSSFDKTLIPFLTEIQPKIEKPAYNKDCNYHKEFWKVFITNEILVASLKEIAMEKVIMEQKVKEYEKIYNEINGIEEQKPYSAIGFNNPNTTDDYFRYDFTQTIQLGKILLIT